MSNPDDSPSLPDSWFVKRGGRGRPEYTLADLMDSEQAAISAEVLAARKGTGRGSLLAAQKHVANVRGIPVETVRTAYRRTKVLRDIGDGTEKVSEIIDEMERRCSGMPDEVRAILEHLPVGRVVGFLRDAGIDGTCPAWFLNIARRGRHLGPWFVLNVAEKALHDDKKDDWLDDLLKEAADLYRTPNK